MDPRIHALNSHASNAEISEVLMEASVAYECKHKLFPQRLHPHYRDGMTDSLIMTLVILVLMAFAWLYILIASRRLDKNGTTTDVGSSVDAKDGLVVRRYGA
ncbi:hypothetical protein OCU04_006912 [Sclerotinia nivalis]|uniref:Uncharacterized protein n=1 Tax=Sclerotinia nivalis TaxID=352851 RepID=A0A9X0ALN3_9HELO|nr:hypothetical protein OCU04_006912 [Sclerotinia nivalis]